MNLRKDHEKTAINKGYEDINESNRILTWNNGTRSPMSENENCTQHLKYELHKELKSLKVVTDIEKEGRHTIKYDKNTIKDIGGIEKVLLPGE